MKNDNGNNQIEYIGESLKRFTDNDINLLNIIISILTYSDPLYTIKLSKDEDKIVGHITCSNPMFREEIISNLLWINRMLKIKIRYSKSLQIQKLISFTINI